MFSGSHYNEQCCGKDTPLENISETPVVAESEKAKSDASTAANQEIFVLPREAFNYMVVAMVFLIIGTLIGFGLANANEAENRQLINQAISQALASGSGAGAQTGADAAPQYLNVSVDDDPSIGASNALVTIIEFGDFHCGFCQRFETETLPQILANYEGRVRYVFRDMPILGQTSIDAAVAAECADDQGRFWEYHNTLFSNQQLLGPRETFISLAQNVGIDVNTFSSCLTANTHLGEVVSDQSEGQRLGLRGTPAFFINGRYVSGAQPYEVFASIIDQELARAQSTNSSG
jgi:protein-disulfide isomerase